MPGLICLFITIITWHRVILVFNHQVLQISEQKHQTEESNRDGYMVWQPSMLEKCLDMYTFPLNNFQEYENSKKLFK